jgi:lipopolysaccharide export system permease protein
MILQRHILTEIAKASSAILIGLLAIFLSMRLATSFADAAGGSLAPQYALRIVALKMLISMQNLIPMSLFIGAYAVITTLQKHSELISMKANGVSHLSILASVSKLSGVAALLITALTCVITPIAELKLIELKETGQSTATITNISSGSFKKFGDGNKIFFAQGETADKSFLTNTFVHDDAKPNDAVMVALRSYVLNDPKTGKKSAIFDAGTSYQGESGKLDYVVTHFKRHTVKIKSATVSDLSRYPTFVPTLELLGQKESHYAAELHWRLALPVFAFLAPLIGVIIALRQRKGYWYLGMTTALGVYFSYLNALGIFKAFVKKDEVSTMLGFVPIRFLFGMLLLLLYLDLENQLHFKRAQITVK